jgi:uncharacterized cupin superfamily protein
MADHEIVNLEQIEDMAVKGGFAEVQEARFAREQLGCEAVGVSLQAVKPGKRGAFGHRHKVDEEVYVVLSGSGKVKLDDELVEVGPMDAIRVAPNVTRGFEAGPEGLQFIAFGSHHDEDAETLQDIWSD